MVQIKLFFSFALTFTSQVVAVYVNMSMFSPTITIKHMYVRLILQSVPLTEALAV